MMLIFISILFMASAEANMESNIHNGQPASIEDFPFQVIVTSYLGSCGGSLISNTFVITAAHCVNSVPANYISVYLGSIYLFGGMQMIAQNSIVHSEYNRTRLRNDIALLEIDYVSYTNSINAIALPDISDLNYNYESESAIISGWGKTNYDDGISRILLYAEVFVISNDDCGNIFRRGTIVDTNICAMGFNEEATCQGDSGGPLAHRDSGVLIGITSFGPKGNCTFVTAYTRVTEYRQWILDNTGI